MDFFRHCPQCGRRFHIILVNKKLAKVVDKETVLRPARTVKANSGIRRTPIYVVVEGEPVTIDTEEFQYAYRCKHCGHEWSEEHTEKHLEKPTTPESDG